MHNSTTEISELIETLFTQHEIKHNLLNILAALKSYGNLDSPHLIYLMRNILYVFSKRVDRKITNLSLTQEQFELFYYELLRIIIELNKSNTQKIDERKLAQIIKRFFLALNKTVKERNESEEALDFDRNSMKQIRENLKKAVIYEIYKFTNPRRIAGESKIENFINNILKGGVAYAKRFELESIKDEKIKYTYMVKNKSNLSKPTIGR